MIDIELKIAVSMDHNLDLNTQANHYTLLVLALPAGILPRIL